MRYNAHRTLIHFTLSCLLISPLKPFAQITPTQIKQYITTNLLLNTSDTNYNNAIQLFYQKNQYQLAWLKASSKQKIIYLCKEINNAEEWAIDLQALYFCKSFQNKLTTEDSISTDIAITKSAIEYIQQSTFGKPLNDLRYTELYKPYEAGTLADLLYKFYLQNSSYDIHELTSPKSELFISAIQLYQTIYKRWKKLNEVDMQISTLKTTKSNTPLLTKLFLLGIIDSLKISNLQLSQKMANAKKLFNNPTSNEQFINQLNVSIPYRLNELKQCLNYIKWISFLNKSSLLGVVNIPGNNMFVYRNDSIIFNTNVIVGKPSTPTPTLSSFIHEIIIYPYWNVPHKIATKELLPAIKRNIGYLDRNNLQVINQNGVMVDPYKLNWKRLSKNRFPYLLRQSTGCDNALGVIKFNFNNPFSVYLHDTPNKDAFELNSRFLSHGCVRVQNPTDFATLLLNKEKQVLDSLTEKCILNPVPYKISVEQPMGIIIMYNTAWFNNHGKIRFFRDRYNKNSFIN